MNAHGAEFYISSVILWILINSEAIQRGQATMFDAWEYLQERINI